MGMNFDKLHDLKVFATFYIDEHEKLSEVQKSKLHEFVIDADMDQMKYFLSTGVMESRENLLEFPGMGVRRHAAAATTALHRGGKYAKKGAVATTALHRGGKYAKKGVAATTALHRGGKHAKKGAAATTALHRGEKYAAAGLAAGEKMAKRGMAAAGTAAGQVKHAMKGALSTGSGKAIAATAIGALASALAFKAYRSFLSKGARACRGQADKAGCMARFRQQARAAKVQALQSTMGKCAKSSNPTLCRQKIQAKVAKAKAGA